VFAYWHCLLLVFITLGVSPSCLYVTYRYQTNTANRMLETIVSIQPKDSGGTGGETREAVVYRLAGDMLAKLPIDYVPHEVTLSHCNDNVRKT